MRRPFSPWHPIHWLPLVSVFVMLCLLAASIGLAFL